MILKERLKFSTPLQKLYEKVYFDIDTFDFERAFKLYDNFDDGKLKRKNIFLLGTVSIQDFKNLVIREVHSIDVTHELDMLVQVVPRTSLGEMRILYISLCRELKVSAREIKIFVGLSSIENTVEFAI